MLRSEQSRQVVQPAKQNYLLYCHDAGAGADREADADVHAGADTDDADADCEDDANALFAPEQSSADSAPPCSSSGKSRIPSCLVAIQTQSP